MRHVMLSMASLALFYFPHCLINGLFFGRWNFYFFLFIFEIFTICFKEAISKLFECLHFERRCYPVIVLPRVEHFLIIIVFYFNTSVSQCRCSLLASGVGGTSSWFTCLFECPVRFRRYLFVILIISSSTNGILESK